MWPSQGSRRLLVFIELLSLCTEVFPVVCTFPGPQSEWWWQNYQKCSYPGPVMCACSPSTPEAEAGGSVEPWLEHPDPVSGGKRNIDYIPNVAHLSWFLTQIATMEGNVPH